MMTFMVPVVEWSQYQDTSVTDPALFSTKITKVTTKLTIMINNLQGYEI